MLIENQVFAVELFGEALNQSMLMFSNPAGQIVGNPHVNHRTMEVSYNIDKIIMFFQALLLVIRGLFSKL